MTTLVQEVFAGSINPGQLKIVRDIVTPTGPTTDIDTSAVFSDVRANYAITGNPDGSIRVEHLIPDGAGGSHPAAWMALTPCATWSVSQISPTWKSMCPSHPPISSGTA